MAANQRVSSPEARLFSGGEVPLCRFSWMARIQGPHEGEKVNASSVNRGWFCVISWTSNPANHL